MTSILRSCEGGKREMDLADASLVRLKDWILLY
jgi:hypothetical protein